MSSFPQIATVGLSGMLVRFADHLDPGANRAALALKGAIDRAGWDGVWETSSTLASAFVRFNPDLLPHADLRDRLDALLAGQDWTAAPLPPGRQHWHVPATFGGADGPQLDEAAALAGVSSSQAIAEFTAKPVQVLTLGFTAGQPYLGPLAPHWDIPRQTALTPRVPPGSLVVAVRQFVLFAADATTGWRQIAQTEFPCIRLDASDPFPLSAGDLMSFHPVSRTERLDRAGADASGMGGAWAEPLP